MRLDEERLRSQRLEDADLFVILIIKKPLVAIRYRLSDGQVRVFDFFNDSPMLKFIPQIRRIQLNFRPEAGYDIAVKALKAWGLPIRDKNSPPEVLVAEPNVSGHLPSTPIRRSFTYIPSQSEELANFTGSQGSYRSQ